MMAVGGYTETLWGPQVTKGVGYVCREWPQKHISMMSLCLPRGPWDSCLSITIVLIRSSSFYLGLSHLPP